MTGRQVWTVYRYYEAAGRLLYVGMTGQGLWRAHGHSRAAPPWWSLVVRGEFEHFITPTEALKRETALILSLTPLYNRAIPPRIELAEATKRQHVKAYLASLDPAQLAATTRSRVAAELTARGVPVDETYAGRILGEWRVTNGSRRRGRG